MSKERLFERIAEWETARKRSQSPRFDDVFLSVLEHLGRVLNTRLGSVPADEGYGVPDLSNIAGSFETGTVNDVAASVLEAVLRSEPRLGRPRIQYREDPRDLTTISLDLFGMIAVEDRNVPVQFGVFVRGSGKVSVSRH